ncbi:MAG: sigma-70 family RNA polymerase sigma factor, partial [Clostridia bacterium]|nr:sigma-70 family RNA polymerase sigma factor [Clostridia bacterium]
MKVLYLQIKKYVDTETQAGKSPSIAEIASNFGITAEDVVFAMDSGRYPVSIFSPLDNDDDGGTLMDKIPSNVDTDRELDHLVLKELISGLEPRDQKIIIMRYYRDKTQSEIAKELGVSQVQVSRLENKILSRLKNNLQVKD